MFHPPIENTAGMTLKILLRVLDKFHWVTFVFLSSLPLLPVAGPQPAYETCEKCGIVLNPVGGHVPRWKNCLEHSQLGAWVLEIIWLNGTVGLKRERSPAKCLNWRASCGARSFCCSFMPIVPCFGFWRRAHRGRLTLKNVLSCGAYSNWFPVKVWIEIKRIKIVAC